MGSKRLHIAHATRRIGASCNGAAADPKRTPPEDASAAEVADPAASRPRKLNSVVADPPPGDAPGPAAPSRANTLNVSGSVPPLRANPHYRIGPGDVLDVRVFRKPELSYDGVKVSEDGMIELPFIKEVRVACLTENEVEEEVRTRLLKYQRNPQVDVIVKGFHSKPVTLIGAVNAPAHFQLQRRVRLLELLANANGPSAKAGSTIQILHTESPASMCEEPATASVANVSTANGSEDIGLVAYNLMDTLRGIEEANPYVRPGDFITVLEAERVYMLGGVNAPGPISLTLKEPLTISRAIVMAGGTRPKSDLKKVRILRQPPGGTTKTQVVVDLNKIKKNEAEDIALQANDVIEVPNVGGIIGALNEIKIPSSRKQCGCFHTV